MTSAAQFRPYRPKFIAALNGVGRLLETLGLRANLDADSLIAAARRKTGLQDFGDESFRAGLEVLTRSLENEAHLHPVGRLIMRQRLIGLLAVRLKAQALFTRYPEIRQQPIKAPLVIAGLQRTGTTMLHRLLASDPRMRAMRSYEAMDPIREDYPAGSIDPRLKATRLAEKALRYMAPEFFAIHPVDADAPEEEILLLDYAFLSDVAESLADVPSYAAWLQQQDVTPAYAYMKALLQLMQWQQPQCRWALKTPAHLGHLDILLKVFPDAKIIQTHRDPARTAASYSSMIAHGHGVFTDEVDAFAVAAHWHRKNVGMVDAALRVRAQHPDAFVDVSYYDVIKDPMAQVRRIYAFAGIELTADAVAAMEATRKKNPQNKHGVHSYKLEDFGLSLAQIRRDYGPYSQFFAIPEEGKTG
ncbi:MAG TPA: sulfotransferase [Rhodocyclaceae bacterium]|nr:sulfotransferase [Rhodocyclaceae bacterium]